MNRLKPLTNKVLGHRTWMSTAGIERSHRSILFPGQGSQYVGMGQDLYNLYPRSAKLVFDEADEALGYGLRAIIFEGQQEQLKLTENAQPAILTTSIAMLRVLETEFGFDITKACNYAMGHSLGEYTALVATKSMSLSDAVRLVRLRGKAMTKAVADKEGKTAMSALVVRKGKLDELIKTIEEIKKTELPQKELVSIANINSSFQVVISGTSQGVDQASRILQQKKLAARAVDLPVSAPFHCDLMKEAADVMKDALQKISIGLPCVKVVSNVTAKPYIDAEEIRKRLFEQVVAPVEWERSIKYCKRQDVDDFLCFGPGKVLANLLKKEYPLDRIRTITSADDILQFLHNMLRPVFLSLRFSTRRITAVTRRMNKVEIEAMTMKTSSIVTPTVSIMETTQTVNDVKIEETADDNAINPIAKTIDAVEVEEIVDPEKYRYVHDNPRLFKGRLGYACVNTYLRKQKPSVFCARTCRLDTALKKGNEYVRELALANIADLKTMIQWNEDHNIKFMRMSSDMFPFASHEKVGYEIDFAAKELADVGNLAKKYNHRLTMHPGQYNQLVSRNPTVVENTIRELHYHAHMMDLMGLDQDSVMIIHMGGVYGDKNASLSRFENVYETLPDHIKRRLVLENDELGYSVSDLLPICQKLKIPLVLDWHHHYINPGTITDLPALLSEIHRIWYDKGINPKEHYSESRKGAVTLMEKRAHSDRVQNLPPTTDDVDLMIEAKDKEQAVFHLYKTYGLGTVDDEVWIPQTGIESKQTKGRKSIRSRKRKAADDDGSIEDEEAVAEVTETRRTTRRSAAAAAAAQKLKMKEEEVNEVQQSQQKKRVSRKKTKNSERTEMPAVVDAKNNLTDDKAVKRTKKPKATHKKKKTGGKVEEIVVKENNTEKPKTKISRKKKATKNNEVSMGSIEEFNSAGSNMTSSE
ncbi:UV-endonuclease UvdE-domain-containing protein [Mycotypha africana]|uniref:UV-endonuclease UvdE-domain-containing protein n=1 Tax=Mycotypha africana TaxID=64632 RepID=UPI0023012C1D|nr:UV-endonuclease UvdE-domain-containing protein [Mycotypha africana]KAI8973250.1 UV-endonuclease UvdE-domain-containing protein [Mycotypha africana]